MFRNTNFRKNRTFLSGKSDIFICSDALYNEHMLQEQLLGGMMNKCVWAAALGLLAVEQGSAEIQRPGQPSDRERVGAWHNGVVDQNRAWLAFQLLGHLQDAVQDRLIRSIQREHMGVLQSILNLPVPVDLNRVDSVGRTPLQVAAGVGNIGILHRLLNQPGIDVNRPGVDQCTPLHIAVLANNLEAVRLFLAQPGIDVNLPNGRGITPLVSAVFEASAEMVQTLLDHGGTDVNRATVVGLTALGTAILQGRLEVVQALLNCEGINVNAARYGCPALIAAVEGENVEIVQALLAHRDTDVNLMNQRGFTALQAAIGLGNEDLVGVLLADERTDVNQPCTLHQETPLHLAIFQNAGVVRLLLARRDIDVHATDEGGFTALSSAVMHGSVEVVRVFMEDGRVDVNEINNGRTALHRAVEGENLAMVHTLLENERIDVTQTDEDGVTALDMARKLGYSDIAAAITRRLGSPLLAQKRRASH